MELKTIALAATFTGLGLGLSPALAEDLRIGLSTPLSGGVAALGQHEKWGAELAIAELNAAGGVDGQALALDAQDNQCNPSQGVTSVENLLQNDPVAIIGALCSSVTLAIMPMVKREEVPLVVAVSTSKVITEKSGVGGNDWTFRINPSDVGLAVAMANYIASSGDIGTVAFVGEDTDYGRGGHEAIAAALEAKGVEVISADFFQQNTPDFTTLLTRLANTAPDAIALYAVGADELNFLRQFRGMGLPAHLTGRIAFDEIRDTVVASGAIDGATSVFPYAADLDTPENQAFVEAFEAKYGELPNYQSFEAYEAVKIIADAVKRAGSSDRTAIRAALETTEYTSLTGRTIAFDENNQAHNAAIILRVDGSEVVIEAQSDT
ncbi:ABC transporter substrate-binding protein [Phaeobacter sp. G2]|nr:ABC transporter substrate-binding protein [Phaeobacter sp. G2]